MRAATKALATGVGVTAVTVALAAPAVAATPEPTVSIGTSAHLGPQGTYVDVPIGYACPAGLAASVSGDLAQAAGGRRIAVGYGYTGALTCDGTEHAGNLRMDAATFVFRKGSGVVRTVQLNDTLSDGTVVTATAGPTVVVIRR
jgi:hypothetical protein